MRIALTMESVMENNEKPDCCFQLAILAQCVTEKQAASVDSLSWGPCDETLMAAQSAAYTRLTGRAVQVFSVTDQEITCIIDTAGSARGSTSPVRVLVVHVGLIAGEWRRHAVPFSSFPRGAILEKYQKNAKLCADALAREALEELARSLEVNHDTSAPTPPQQPDDSESPPQSSSTILSAAAKPNQDASTQTTEEKDIFEIWPEHMLSDSNGHYSWTQVAQPTTLPQFPWTPLCSDDVMGRRHPTQLSVEHEFCSYLRPTASFESSFFQSALLSKTISGLFAPDIAIASVGNVRRYGTRCLYMFTDQPGRCTLKGKADYLLQHRDRLTGISGSTWHFKKKRMERFACRTIYDTFELTLDKSQLADVSILDTVWIDIMPSIINNPLSNAVVIEAVSPMPASIRNNVEWRMEHLSEPDPALASLLAYARAKAAGGDDLPAQATARSIRANARAFKGALIGFGGAYSWGYCYGCGDSCRGKYEMRLCKACRDGKMSSLGKAIADGCEVTSGVTPVLYPNFVVRPKSHPPLKDGIETTECDDSGKPKLGGRVRVYSEKKKQQLTFEQIQGLTRPGKGPWGAGILLDGAMPFITSGGTQPLVEAILFRVFKKLYFADNGSGPKRERTVDAKAFENANRLAESPLLLQRFLESTPTAMRIVEYILSNPNPARRKALFEAWRLWDERGEHSEHWEEINAFVKQENLPYFAPKNGVLNSAAIKYVARLIQAPSDESHLVAGPYIKPLMKELKSCWNSENWIFYGAATPEKLDSWLQKIKGCQSFFWSDYSSFDATFSDHTWDMIEGFYRRIYPNADSDFWDVMRFWRKPKGRMIVRADNTRVEYDADTCNCSGRDDTALANALFNGIALSTSIAAALADKSVLDITEDDLFRASNLCKISIMGDDSLVGCDFDVEPIAGKIVRELERFGLIVKAEHSRSLNDVTYLGMMPYATAEGTYQWGPTLGRRLYKMFWMRELKAPGSWARGVAEQGKLWQNVPLLPEICGKIEELLKGKSITREKADPIKPWHSRTEVTQKWSEITIRQLCERYPGLTAEMFESDLNTIKSITRLPCVVRLHTLEAILQKDDL